MFSAVVEEVFAHRVKTALVLTGGGVSCVPWLLAVPGASEAIVDVSIPYHRQALAQYLGSFPDGAANQTTAIALALAALRRARSVVSEQERDQCAGVACTASLVSKVPKKGAHRVFVAACRNEESVHVYSCELQKGRSRAQEDELASTVVLRALADISGIPNSEPLVPWRADDPLQCLQISLRDPVESLLAGHVRFFFLHSEHGVQKHSFHKPEHVCVILPGSFNPLHWGHEALLRAASSMVPRHDAHTPSIDCCAYELSVENADKGLLAAETVRSRVAQFAARHAPILVTRAPLFVTKASLFPHTRFVIGFDTAVRVLSPRYYDSEAHMIAVLAGMHALTGCDFLVAGRGDANDRFCSPQALAVPPPLASCFNSLHNFREDISSTQIRSQLHPP